MARRPDQPDLLSQIPEGVHLGQPTHIYGMSPAIGADDLRGLYWDPTSWWASSRNNTQRYAPARANHKAGQHLEAALTSLVLQGEDAYASRFTIEPDDGRSDLARTRDQIKELLARKQVKIPYGDFSDKTLFSLVRQHGLAHKVFATARKDYEAAVRSGRGSLTEKEDRRVRAFAQLMTGHKAVGPVFQGGLSDVAVFWRRADDPDTMLRARFRKLRRQRTYELVALSNWQGRDTDAAIAQTIKDRDLEIARCLQHEAFEQLVRFVDDGQVHGWEPDGRPAHVLASEREALEGIAAAGMPAWVWLFYQIPAHEIGREKAAVIAPRSHAPEGRLWNVGQAKIEQALSELRSYRDRFSMDRPWVLVEDLKELVDTDVSPRTKKES